MGKKAKDIMTSEVIVVEEDMSVNKLIELFLNRRISGAPVVNEKSELLGIVTKTDVLGHFLDIDLDLTLKVGLKDILNLGSEPQDVEMSSVTNLKVRSIMTPDPITAGEDADIETLAETMIRNNIHRLPITRDNKVVGIVSTLDLLYYVAGIEKHE